MAYSSRHLAFKMKNAQSISLPEHNLPDRKQPCGLGRRFCLREWTHNDDSKYFVRAFFNLL